MGEYTIPVVRLTVEGMKHTICAALLEEQARIDQDIQDAVCSYLNDNEIWKVVRETVYATMNKVIREEIEHWFIWGAGREAIHSAVEAVLTNLPLSTPECRKESSDG